VVVAPRNYAPKATKTIGVPDAVSGVVTGQVTGTDADADTLAYRVSTAATKGVARIDAVTGAFTYTPKAVARHAAARIGATTAEKTDTFTVSVIDGYGGVTAVPMTVVVAPRNYAPKATKTIGVPDAVSGVVTGQVTGTDADADTLAYRVSTAAAKGVARIDAVTGAFTYTPKAIARHAAARIGATTAEKTDTFTVSVIDGYGGVTAVPMTVRIAPVNAKPVPGATVVGLPDPSTGVVTGRVSVTDADNDTLTFSGPEMGETSKGSVTVTADGAFTYAPTPEARRSAYLPGAPRADLVDRFTVTATDGHNGTVTVPVTVTISPELGYYVSGDVKRDPVTGAIAMRTPFSSGFKDPMNGTPGYLNWVVGPDSRHAFPADVATWDDLFLVGTVVASNPYDPSVALPRNSVLRNPTTGAVAIRTMFPEDQGSTLAGLAWWAAAPSGSASHLSTSSVAGWDVILVPGAGPTVRGYTTEAPAANGAVSGKVNAADPDGDALVYSAQQSTAKGYVKVEPDSGEFTYVPTAAARQAAAKTGAVPADKSDTFTVTVSDGYFASSKTINVPISPGSPPRVGDIRAQPNGTFRVIYAPNVSIGHNWVGVNPENGGQWFTDAEVDGWMDVSPPTGAEQSGVGPYSPGDIKVPPGSIAGDVTVFAVKTGGWLSNKYSWMVCHTRYACHGSSDTDEYMSAPVGQWVDLEVPLADHTGLLA
jgi:VCBS repeat-containing protein